MPKVPIPKRRLLEKRANSLKKSKRHVGSLGRSRPNKVLSKLPTPTRPTQATLAFDNPKLPPPSFAQTYFPKVGKHWPNFVLVLDKDTSLEGPPYSHPVNGEPCTINAWVDNEFRGLHSAPLHNIRIALDIWWSIHFYLVKFIGTKNLKVPTYTLYNTIWAYLGYTEGQDPEAIQLALSFRNEGGPPLEKIYDKAKEELKKSPNKKATRHSPSTKRRK